MIRADLLYKKVNWMDLLLLRGMAPMGKLSVLTQYKFLLFLLGSVNYCDDRVKALSTRSFKECRGNAVTATHGSVGQQVPYTHKSAISLY
jgi:hypothetical protein